MGEGRRPDAILIVHGIGEQVSNDTARSLAVALADPTEDRVRSAADPSIDGAKQRVYSIVWNIDSPAVSPESQVSEGYWAYRFRDTTWSHLTGWLLPLIRRPRRDAPQRLRVGAAWLSNLIVAVAGVAGLLTVIASWADVPLGSWLADTGYVAAALVGGALLLLLGMFVFVPRKEVPKRMALGAVAVVGLIAVLDLLFSWLVAENRSIGPVATPIAALVALVLVSLAVDALTSVRVLAVVTATLVLTFLGTATNQDDAGTTVLALIAAAAAPWASAAGAALLLPSLGDAARYFRDHPSNETESRNARKIVIDRLRELHRLENGRPRFERVIVIAHSLGSVIAYDAINHFWSETNRPMTVGGPLDCETCESRDRAALRLEATASNLVAEPRDSLSDARRRLADYREAQWTLCASLRAEPTVEHRKHWHGHPDSPGEPPWLVTDFITVGSPLASAGFLAEPGGAGRSLPEPLGGGTEPGDPSESPSQSRADTPVAGSARAAEDAGRSSTISTNGDERVDTPNLPPDDIRQPAQSWFAAKLAAREYPSCPPLPQTAASIDPILLFSEYPLRYSQGQKGGPSRRRHLHHAAAFAPTRWTNVYFENDLVGGPLSAQLGRGILDIEVPVARPSPHNFVSLFSHSSYWREPSVGRLSAAAQASRAVLTDLVELRVERDTLALVEVENILERPDVMWCDDSPAQSAVRSRLERLESRRKAAFVAARRNDNWSATLDVLGRSTAPDAAEFRSLMQTIHRRHRGDCVAVVAYGEVALYRVSDDDLHRHTYRMIGLEPTDGARRCRLVDGETPWPGAVELMDLDGVQRCITEFLGAE